MAIGLLWLLAGAHAFAQTADLTGMWQAENGLRYSLRQIGNELFWSMDDRPRVANIFSGTIEGMTVTGRWVDMPGGQQVNSGTLTLRIESPDRLVKVASSIPYGESVWTRTGAPAETSPPSASPAPETTWATQASQWRGQNGRRYALACLPGGPTAGRLWGTDVYTDDSSVCLAAVHAGLIAAAAGGVVTIEIRPGQSAYLGSTRFGVTSQAYGGWDGSFVFAGAAPPTAIPPSPTPVPSGSPVTWSTQADPWRGRNGERFTVACPPNGAPGRLYGTDIYTDDSSICTAAVHAGLITTLTGGTVMIEIRPGQSSYQGTARNGVTSNGWGEWTGSFVFVGGAAGPPAARGICDDPRTLALMDEWLARAIPPQEPGESLRYEAWGRLVGRSRTATITVSGPPDTRLSRCEYLWQIAPQLRSTNLGTLRAYLDTPRR